MVRKGARKARIPLTPATIAALEAYLGVGGQLRQGHLWELVRRFGPHRPDRRVGQLSPHSLRHSVITFASLDAGAALRDAQDYAGHKDSRTTRRYGHSLDNLDRNAAYTVAAYLA